MTITFENDWITRDEEITIICIDISLKWKYIYFTLLNFSLEIDW